LAPIHAGASFFDEDRKMVLVRGKLAGPVCWSSNSHTPKALPEMAISPLNDAQFFGMGNKWVAKSWLYEDPGQALESAPEAKCQRVDIDL
jgi:hypothetical protein